MSTPLIAHSNTTRRLGLGLRPFLSDGRRAGVSVDWDGRAPVGADWISHAWGGWSLLRPVRPAPTPADEYEGPFGRVVDAILFRRDGAVLPRRLRFTIPSAAQIREMEDRIEAEPDPDERNNLRAELQRRRDVRVAIFPSPNAAWLPTATTVFGMGPAWARLQATRNGALVGLGQCDRNGAFELAVAPSPGATQGDADNVDVLTALPPAAQMPDDGAVPQEAIDLGSPTAQPPDPDPGPLLTGAALPTTFNRQAHQPGVAVTIGRRTRLEAALTVPA